jgi:hypothetical protein
MIEPWLWAEGPEGQRGAQIRSGKWMLFSSPAYHEEVWRTIKAATEAGTLGYLAKTANPEWPGSGHLRSLVTLVYTRDYEEIDDVRRVLVALRGLGFNATLSYKRDEDTVRESYGQGVSIYVSPKGTLDFEDRRA